MPDFVLLNCGPSLNDYSENTIREFAKGKGVGAVKLAYYKVPDIVDIHWFNCSNTPKKKNGIFYDYKEGRPKSVVMSSNFPIEVRMGKKQDHDLFYEVPIISPSNYLVCTGDFDSNLRSRQKTVYPGIMGETVLPSIVELGVNNLYVFGWDLTQDLNSSKNYKHSWSKNQQFELKGSFVPWEIEASIKTSRVLYLWLKKHKVNLHLIGNKSSLWEGIPRIEL